MPLLALEPPLLRGTCTSGAVAATLVNLELPSAVALRAKTSKFIAKHWRSKEKWDIVYVCAFSWKCPQQCPIVNQIVSRKSNSKS